jgi:GT2 family glycosyltransferase
MLTCAIMVLNWNGAAWLERCLPSIVEAADVVGAEVWVVDNRSDDNSAEVCSAQFPTVRFETMPGNDVLASYNVAAERCTSDIVVFLNNDIVVTREFLVPLLAEMCEPDVFAVAPMVRSFPPSEDAPIELEAEFPIWTKGMIRGAARSPKTVSPTYFTLGGAMACCREKFVSLGGFDDLYLPGYSEDIDLSWRAWKRGWRCLYVPASTVYHAGGVSMGRSTRIRTIMLRNEFLFHWKLLTSPRLMAVHLLTTVPRLLTALLRRDANRIRGFFEAVTMIPQALRRRGKARAACVYSDEEVIRRFAQMTIGM